MKYVVIRAHRSEYPHPIHLNQGDEFEVGERYNGPESWSHWYLCVAAGQAPGWVPGPLIEACGAGRGRALEDYSAQELDVDPGHALVGHRHLNGWVWCTQSAQGCAGWVPESHLQALPEG